jgi:hypothetical protein
MSTKYVRVVPSSDPTGPSLSGEINQAFDKIRERAYAIYDSRATNVGSDYEDWLQAERELFEIPDVEVQDDGKFCRLVVHAEASRSRPLTIGIEPEMITVLGKTTDGLINLFRRVNLASPVDPEQVRVAERNGSIELSIAEAAVQREAPRRAMAATAGPQVYAA